MVATRDGQVVATHGDIKAEVNRGINCVKGYFLSKIMYGSDRLTRPLLRMKDGKFDKQGEFQPISWEQALRHHGREVQGRAQGQGTGVGRHVRLRPVDGLGRLCGEQAVQGRPAQQQHRPQRPPLHGLGGDGLHAQLRHGRADGLLRRHRGHRQLRPLGLEHGRDAPGALVAGHRPPAQRAAGQGRGAVHLRAPQLRAGRLAHGVQAADRPDHPQLYRQPHHRERRGEPRLRRAPRALRPWRRGHRLRPAPGRPAGEEGEERRQGQHLERYRLQALRRVRQALYPGAHRARKRRAGRAAEGPRRTLRRPQAQGGVVLDHGLQPAHPRGLGEQPDLQHPPAHREDQRTGQQPLLAHRPALGLRHRARGRHLLHRLPPTWW